MDHIILELLNDLGLKKYTKEILHIACNSIYFNIEGAHEDSMPLGATKIGGRPDVSRSFHWPTVDNRYLSFLAQVNLEEVVAYDTERRLPTQGILYFFYDSEAMPWGFDPKDKGSWRVIYNRVPCNLCRLEYPMELSEQPDLIYDAASTILSTKWSLPDWEELGLALDDDQVESYIDAFTPEDNDQTYLLGYPQWIQDDVRIDCAATAKNIYMGDNEQWELLTIQQKQEIILDSKKWILLLQLDSVDVSNMMWGDEGRLYFMIREDDLAQREFENVWLVLQCY